MRGQLPGLIDRLTAGDPTAAPRTALEALKDAVARDLEALLNTRCSFLPAQLAGYPLCAQSLLTYGMVDFAGRSLASAEDRTIICAALQATVEQHEPRLARVRAALDLRPDTVNRLAFVIHGVLVADRSGEMISFDAVLQPSSLQYTVGRARASASPGRG